MKKNLLILTAIFVLSFLTGCNSSEETDKTVDMPDLKVEKGNTGNEVVFDDNSIAKQKKTVSTYGQTQMDQTFTNKDGSEVKITFDAVGNKTSFRKFFNSSNLTFLQITETPTGEKEGILFGYNGTKKILTPEMIDIAFTASGDEIASKAGIYSPRREKTRETAVKHNQVPFYPSQTFPTQESFNNRQPTQPQTTETQPQPVGEPQTETPPANPPTTQNGKIKGEN